MLIHVTNITRDILGYKNNTIVFFSAQGMSKHSSTPVWAKLNGKNLISKLRSLQRHTTFKFDKFYLNTKLNKREFRLPCKNNASAWRMFSVSKFKGICFIFERCFSRAGMNNRTRDVVCTLARADSALSYLLWSGIFL